MNGQVVDITRRVELVRAQIAAACARAGRRTDDVTLVAASKMQSEAAVRAAFAAGVRDFGENYASELRDKQAVLGDVDIRWHFIGRVQASNAKIIARTSLVHGVGSWSQLQALAKASSSSTPLAVLLQVNLTAEESKNGFSADALRRVVDLLPSLPSVEVRGLMAMPLVEADELPAAFAAVRQLRDDLAGARWPILSMGMSGDFAAAIAAGATHVRIGTSLFGPRGAG